MMTGK